MIDVKAFIFNFVTFAFLSGLCFLQLFSVYYILIIETYILTAT